MSFYGDATPRHDEEKDENRNDGEDDDEVTVSEVPPPSFKARRRNASKYFKSPFTQIDDSTVFFHVNVKEAHWMLGELRLDTMKIHIYDSFLQDHFYDCLFIMETWVPQQSGPLGDCAVWSCLLLEYAISGVRVPVQGDEDYTPTDYAAKKFRERMGRIYWASRSSYY
ncbi:hypothetical protein L2E82_10323 [Cichorium intybus]|uniref:Uncharacterized protein n=1 Tax=Cichorium intybus TaxID=13427 RepID=A0ACB9GAB2_CICIN|nr:hypothetical protein L2E82_10323 [Cichorium intybus]